jgi:hypothetical protein
VRGISKAQLCEDASCVLLASDHAKPILEVFESPSERRWSDEYE